jgi:hypothetical protein
MQIIDYEVMVMNRIVNLDELTRSTRRREFEDGLADLVNAGVFLVIGLLGWLSFSPAIMRWYIEALIQNREITIIGSFTLVPLLVLLMFGARRVIDRVRRAMIWKDSGFVKSLRWQVDWRVTLLACAVSVIMIIGAAWLMSKGLLTQEHVLRVLVSSGGVATGITFFGMGRELKLRRYVWVGIAGGAISAVIMLLPTAFSVSWLLLGVIWMGILSFSGLCTLRRSLLSLEEQSSD